MNYYQEAYLELHDAAAAVVEAWDSYDYYTNTNISSAMTKDATTGLAIAIIALRAKLETW